MARRIAQGNVLEKQWQRPLYETEVIGTGIEGGGLTLADRPVRVLYTAVYLYSEQESVSGETRPSSKNGILLTPVNKLSA